MTNPNPQNPSPSPAETTTPVPETAPVSGGGMTVDTLAHAADTAHETVGTMPDMQAALQLDAFQSPALSDEPNAAQEQYQAGIMCLQFHLTHLLGKIAKQNPKANIEKLRPQELNRFAQVYGSPEEILMVQKYLELTATKDKRAFTAIYLKDKWEDMVYQARQSTSESYPEKYMLALKHDPKKTLGYTALALGGVYVGYRILKALFSSGKEDENGKKESFFSRFLPSGKAGLGALGLILGGLFLGKGGLDKLLKSLLPEELAELMKKKDQLSAEIRERLDKLEAFKSKAEEAKAKAEEVAGKAKTAVTDAADKAREVVTDKEHQKNALLAGIQTALVGVYCLDDIEFGLTLKNTISTTLSALVHSGVKMSSVLAAYRAVPDKTDKNSIIDTTHFGMDAQNGNAFFHACKLLADAYERHHKNYPGKDMSGETVETFLLDLARDPSHSIHQKISEALITIDITDVNSAKAKITEIFKKGFTEETIGKDKERHLTDLAERFGVKVPETDKGMFTVLAIKMYERGNLMTSPEAMRTFLQTGLTEKASAVALTAALDLFERIKERVIGTKEKEGLLAQVIKRYDTHRPDTANKSDDENYDQLLSRYLTPDQLTFKDAVQMAVLSEGIKWEDSGTAGTTSEMKDVAMFSLIGHILSHVRKDEYVQEKYLASMAWMWMMAPTNIDLGFLEPIVPYLGTIGGILVRKAKNALAGANAADEAMPRPSDAPDFPEHSEDAGFMEWFAEGKAGSLQIPRALFHTVVENFGLSEDAKSPEGFWQYLKAVGATLFYSPNDEKSGVYLLGNYFLVQPVGIFKDTIRAFFSEKGSTFKTYMVEGAPYVFTSAALGAAGAMVQQRSIIGAGVALLRGAARGVTLPISYPYAAFRGARGVWRFEQRVRLGQGNAQNMRKSLDLFLRYKELALDADLSPVDKFKICIRQPHQQVRKMLLKDIYMNGQQRWGRLFVRDYNSFFGIVAGKVDEGAKATKAHELLKGKKFADMSMNEVEKLARRMSQLMEELSKIENKATKAHELLKGKKFADMSMNEVEKLARRMSQLMEELSKIENIETLGKDKLIEALKTIQKTSKIEGEDALSTMEFQRLERKLKDPKTGDKFLAKFRERLTGIKMAPEASRMLTADIRVSALIAEHEARIAKAVEAGKDTALLKESLQRYESLRKLLEVNGPHARFMATHMDDLSLILWDSPRAQMALKQFLEIDSEVMRAIGKNRSASEQLATLFKNMNAVESQFVAGGDVSEMASKFRGYQEAVAKLTTEYEGKIGVRGKIRRGVDKWKATRAEKRGLRSGEWYAGYDKFEGVKFSVKDMNALAKLKDVDEIAAALRAKGVAEEVAQKMAVQISQSGGRMEAIGNVIKRVSEAEGLAVKFAPRLSAAMKFLRFGGGALSGLGAVVYGAEAYSAFSEAVTTQDAKRRQLLIGKGTLYGAASAVEATGAGALVGSAFGLVEAGTAGTIGAFALPLVPITYAATGIFDEVYETTKTPVEWAQEIDPRRLIHEWIATSTESSSLGELRPTSHETVVAEKQATRKKIVEALLIQENHGQPADPDRMRYVEVMCYFEPEVNYGVARRLLSDSKIYADLMLKRRIELETKKDDPTHTLMIGNIDLLTKYDHMIARDMKELLAVAETSALSVIPPQLKENFDQFSTAYLIDLYGKSWSLRMNEEDTETTENQIVFAEQLRLYLTFARHLNTEQEYFNWMAKKNVEEELETAKVAQLKAESIAQIARFQENPTAEYKKDLVQQSDERGVRALTDLAEFFGYAGNADEETLKLFFDEDHGGMYGIYWDGDDWCVNQKYALDTTIGPELDRNAVIKMGTALLVDPDKVIETRQDAMVDIQALSLEPFVDQVKQMAAILMKGLTETPPQSKDLPPAFATPDEDGDDLVSQVMEGEPEYALAE